MDGQAVQTETQSQTPTTPVVETNTVAQSANVASQGASPPSPIVKPDGLPDQYFDPQKGVKTDDLIKRFGELDALRAQDDVRKSLIPETPDKYNFKLPTDFQAPDGIEIRLDEKSPLLKSAREFAHTTGLTQQQFEGLVALHASNLANDAKAYESARAAFVQGLGSNGAQRLSNIQTALSSIGNPQGAADLMMATVTKAGVEALEQLIGAKLTSGAGNFGQAGRVESKQASDIGARWFNNSNMRNA